MAKTESQKVHEIYSLIGERGLYVNTNLDLFGGPTKDVTILTSAPKAIIKRYTKI